MCLPGLGQFYAGDIKNGINSLVINALFVGLFTYSFVTISPIDAYFSVLPWFQRYYKGGYTKAGIIAEQKVKKRRAKKRRAKSKKEEEQKVKKKNSKK